MRDWTIGRKYESLGGRSRYSLLVLAGLLSVSLGCLLGNSYDHVVHRLDRLIGQNPQLSWPTVQDTILASELVCVQQGNEKGWSFIVRFAYDVEGRRYSGQQQLYWYEVVPFSDLDEKTDFLKWGCDILQETLGMVPPEETQQEAVREKLKYAPGQEVAVHYNASNPANGAVIVPGLLFGVRTTWGETIWLIAGFISLLGGIVILIIGAWGLFKRS